VKLADKTAIDRPQAGDTFMPETYNMLKPLEFSSWASCGNGVQMIVSDRGAARCHDGPIVLIVALAGPPC
jgi:hypothetical protein